MFRYHRIYRIVNTVVFLNLAPETNLILNQMPRFELLEHEPAFGRDRYRNDSAEEAEFFASLHFKVQRVPMTKFVGKIPAVGALCAFCGKSPARTKDHMPPREAYMERIQAGRIWLRRVTRQRKDLDWIKFALGITLGANERYYSSRSCSF
jgi:hypothetical protein